MSDLSIDLIGVIAGCAVGGFLIIIMSVVIIVICCRKTSTDSAYDDMVKKYQQGAYAMPPGSMSNTRAVYHNSQQPLWKRSVRRLKTVMGYPEEKRSQYPPKIQSFVPQTITNENDFYPQNSLKSTGSSTKQIASSDPNAMTSSIPRPKIKSSSQSSNTSMPVQGNQNYPQNSLKKESLKRERRSQSYIERCYAKLTDTGMTRAGKPLYVCHPQDYSHMNHLFDVVGKTREGNFILRPASGTPLRPRHLSSKKKSRPKERATADAGPLERKPVKRVTSDREVRRPHGSQVPRPGTKAANPPSFYFSGPDLSTLGRGPPQLQVPPSFTRHQFEQAPAPKSSASQARKPPVEEKKDMKRSPESKGKPLRKKDKLNQSKGSNKQDGVAKAIITSSNQQSNRANDGAGTANQAFALDEGDLPSSPPPDRERSGSVSTLKSLGPRKVAAEFSFLDQFDSDNEKDLNL